MIKSIGVEIEGGFGELPDHFFSSNNPHKIKIFRTDVSVKNIDLIKCSRCSHPKRDCGCGSNRQFEPVDIEEGKMLYVGELASFPHTTINSLIKFMREYYALKTNKYCGLHTHIMPDSHLEYQKLMTQKFYRDLIKALRYFGESRGIKKDSEFWRRLNGQERYCKRGFDPIKQGQNSSSDRYRLLNFCHGKHGTIEIRVLPAFQNKEIAIDSIRYIYDYVNSWLLINRKFMKPIKISKELPKVEFT